MNWEKQIDNTTHYIHINHFQVVFGSTLGSGHTDNAGTASHADFLAGRVRDDIRRICGGNVLKDVIASVRSVENNPIFAKKLRAEQTLLMLELPPGDTGPPQMKVRICRALERDRLRFVVELLLMLIPVNELVECLRITHAYLLSGTSFAPPRVPSFAPISTGLASNPPQAD